MNLGDLAKQILINENIGKHKAKYTGKYQFLLREDERKITIEFVNSKKKGIIIYLNYYGHVEEMTLKEFLDELNYNRKPFVEKVINVIKTLSIKYYGFNIGFKNTIDYLFSRKRPTSDIKIVADFLGDSDIYIKANGSIIYDDEETNLRKKKEYDKLAKVG